MNNVESRTKRNEDDIKTLWIAVEDIKQKMMYRLPLWATMLIALLTGVVGFLLRAVLAKA